MEIEKIAHEITMVLLQCQYSNRPATQKDMAEKAAHDYVVCKKAVLDTLSKELTPGEP